MKRIGTLKRKKGFTLAELVVVIAIIGVLIAMIVPALSPNDRPTAGKGYAKDFFYASQSYMSKRKLSGAGTLSGDGFVAAAGDSLVLYADMSGTTLDDTHCGVAVPGDDDLQPCSGMTDPSDADLQRFTEGFMREINDRISHLDYGGTLYVVVDDAYRVRATYWSDGAWTDIHSATFASSCVLNGSGDYACSFPTTYCTPIGSTTLTMFDLS